MQNDNPAHIAQQMTQPATQQPAVHTQPPTVAPAQSASQNTLEYAMLVLALVTLGSFMVGNGYLLKIGLIMVMVVAITSIFRNLNSAKTVPIIRQSESAQPASVTNKKPMSVIKLLGITALAIILLPVLGYMAMIAFFIVLLMFGGGNMGT